MASGAAALNWRSAPTCGPAWAWCAAGAGTALVGDPHTVAARMREYADLGIDTFVLSGYPHLEEAYRFAELVFPLLPRAVRDTLPGNVLNGPFGEVIATGIVPRVAAS